MILELSLDGVKQWFVRTCVLTVYHDAFEHRGVRAQDVGRQLGACSPNLR
jgi:hypothetical protein